jgi:hypothetical protein
VHESSKEENKPTGPNLSSRLKEEDRYAEKLASQA